MSAQVWSGNRSRPMPPRPVDKTLHGVTDYTVGTFLVTAAVAAAGSSGVRSS